MDVTMAYIEEPDIPVGMTVQQFRRTLPPRRRRRLRALFPRVI